MLTAIIVAGGRSQRMGFDKLLAPLANKPLLAHTLAAFERTKSVSSIILVGREDRLAEFEGLARGEKIRKLKAVVSGGEERQDSVRAGLTQLGPNAEFVAVHDAARPLITPDEIERVFKVCHVYRAAALGEPLKDTIKRVNESGMVSGSVDRDKLYALQTPQIFWRELLVKAYEFVAARRLKITDETSAITHLGEPVAVVLAKDFNFKITFPTDLPLAEFILSRR